MLGSHKWLALVPEDARALDNLVVEGCLGATANFNSNELHPWKQNSTKEAAEQATCTCCCKMFQQNVLLYIDCWPLEAITIKLQQTAVTVAYAMLNFWGCFGTHKHLLAMAWMPKPGKTAKKVGTQKT